MIYCRLLKPVLIYRESCHYLLNYNVKRRGGMFVLTQSMLMLVYIELLLSTTQVYILHCYYMLLVLTLIGLTFMSMIILFVFIWSSWGCFVFFFTYMYLICNYCLYKYVCKPNVLNLVLFVFMQSSWDHGVVLYFFLHTVHVLKV